MILVCIMKLVLLITPSSNYVNVCTLVDTESYGIWQDVAELSGTVILATGQ